MVGAARFELATTCTPCRYATRLRYAPTCYWTKTGILRLQLLEDGAQFALDRRDIHAGRGGGCGHRAHRAGQATVAHDVGLGLVFVGDGTIQAVARAADGEAFFVEQ